MGEGMIKVRGRRSRANVNNTPFSGEGSRGAAWVGRDAAAKDLIDATTGEMHGPSAAR